MPPLQGCRMLVLALTSSCRTGAGDSVSKFFVCREKKLTVVVGGGPPPPLPTPSLLGWAELSGSCLHLPPFQAAVFLRESGSCSGGIG